MQTSMEAGRSASDWQGPLDRMIRRVELTMKANLNGFPHYGV